MPESGTPVKTDAQKWQKIIHAESPVATVKSTVTLATRVNQAWAQLPDACLGSNCQYHGIERDTDGVVCALWTAGVDSIDRKVPEGGGAV